MRKKQRKRQPLSGFVLIETLFAVFLIFTAALIVAATMPVANVSRNKTQLNDKAMDLAQKQIEAIRTAGFANANANQLASLNLIDSATAESPNVFTFTNTDSANLDNPSLVLPNGAGTIMIEQLNLNMVRITVQVTWTDQGTPESYTIGSLEANL